MFVAQTCQKSGNLENSPIYSPLTPDQPPLRGGRYVSLDVSSVRLDLSDGIFRGKGGGLGFSFLFAGPWALRPEGCR